MKSHISLQSHSSPVRHISFSPDGELLFTAGTDKRIVSWRMPRGEKDQIFNHSSPVNHLVIGDTSEYLFSGDNSGILYLWSIVTGELLAKYDNKPFYSIQGIDLFESFLLVLYRGNTNQYNSYAHIYLVDLFFLKEKPTHYAEEIYDQDSIYSIAFKKTKEKKKTKMISSKNIFPLKVFETKVNEPKYSCSKFYCINDYEEDAEDNGSSNNNNSYSKSNSNSNNNSIIMILIGKDDGIIDIIDYDTYTTVSSINTHSEQIMNIDVYDNYMLSCSKDGKAAVYDIDTNEMISLLQPFPKRHLNCGKIISKQTTFSGNDVNMLFDEYKKEEYPNSSRLSVIVAGGLDQKLIEGSGYNNKTAVVFDILDYDVNLDSDSKKTNELIFQVNSHSGYINSLDYNRKYNIIASGSDDASIKLFYNQFL